MGSRVTVLVGLLAGALAGALAIGALLLYLPGPMAPGPSAAPDVSVPPGTPAATPEFSAASTSVPTPTTEAASAAASGSPSALFGIGQPAPDLVLPLIGGGAVDLSTLRGKPVWINFMASWCPPCLDELPLMAGFGTRYAETGLVVIAVDVREDEATAAAFAKMVGIPFDVALDADGAAQAAWGATALPTHFWIDADGIVREGALGGLGPDLMAAGLGAILPGVTVTP